MNASLGGLGTCGCCGGLTAETPTLVWNRPGLPAISYRVGTHSRFKKTMLAALSAAARMPLHKLQTRDNDDFTIALVDAAAMIADVLTFYQERIANESYMRTATERRSLLELARLIGYELRAGVAASTDLAFTLENGSGAPRQTTIDIGTKVQSIPGPGEQAQTFETVEKIEARPEWNAIRPRLARDADLALSNGKVYLLGIRATFRKGTYVLLPASQVYLLDPRTPLTPSLNLGVPAVEITQLYLQGTSTNLKAGDRILLAGTSGTTQQTQPFVVREVEVDSNLNTTLVKFASGQNLPSFVPASLPFEIPEQGKVPFNHDTVRDHILLKSISETDLQAFLKTNDWDARELSMVVNTPPSSLVTDEVGVFALRASSAFFGNNAPPWKSLPDPTKSQRGDPYPQDWDNANNGQGRYIWTDSQGNPYPEADAYLERSFPQVLPNSWALFESPTVQGAVYRIDNRVDRSLADYSLSGKASGLTLRLRGDVRGKGLSMPSAVSWEPKRLDSFAVGLDGHLYHEWWNGEAWGTPEKLGGGNFVNSPSAVSWAADRLDIFTIGTDGNLYHTWWDRNVWGGPEKLGGGNFVNSPSAVSWAADRLDIFIIGTDGNLYHTWWDGNAWGGPENLGGGNFVNSPSAVSWAADRLDTFTIGTDGNLYHTWWDGNAWGGPENLGSGNFVNSPSAVSWAADRLDTFTIGTDGNLYHTWWDGNAWGGPENLGGGNFVNSPSAVSWAADRLDIFTVGEDGNLYDKWWDGSAWGGPENVGGNGKLTSAPSATAWSANRLDIFMIGASGHLFHMAWNGSAWGGPNDLDHGNLAPFPVRTTSAFVQSEQLDLISIPVVDDIPAGTTELMLNNLLLGLKPGHTVALSGMRADAVAVAANEILSLDEIVHVGGFTVLKFKSGSQYSYARSSVVINANVAAATHGETVKEVLGNGDASQPYQKFALRQPPLTYVSAANADGAESTLEVRVDDLLWHEVPTLYSHGSKDHVYVSRNSDDNKTTVEFGDGVTGARLPSGQNNVRSVYRKGIGLDGLVNAGQLSMLLSRPLGVKGVTNPLEATGAENPEQLADARRNAPLRVLTLDRIVSARDYEDFATAFAGIAKALATWTWDGDGRGVLVTVAGPNGALVKSDNATYDHLLTAMQNAGDPFVRLRVESYRPVSFRIAANVKIKPDFSQEKVLPAVEEALRTRFAFAARTFAEPVMLSEVIAVMQAVPGIVAVDVDKLYRSDATSATLEQRLLADLPATLSDGQIDGAELLTLDPAPLDYLGVMK